MRLEELGRLLDEIDPCSDPRAQINALQDALTYSVGVLVEHGFEIPRGDELEEGSDQ